MLPDGIVGVGLGQAVGNGEAGLKGFQSLGERSRRSRLSQKPMKGPVRRRRHKIRMLEWAQRHVATAPDSPSYVGFKGQSGPAWRASQLPLLTLSGQRAKLSNKNDKCGFAGAACRLNVWKHARSGQSAPFAIRMLGCGGAGRAIAHRILDNINQSTHKLLGKASYVVPIVATRFGARRVSSYYG